jgi:hypothetical protein
VPWWAGKSTDIQKVWLAKLADKGKITAIFFADGYGVMQVRNPLFWPILSIDFRNFFQRNN